MLSWPECRLSEKRTSFYFRRTIGNPKIKASVGALQLARAAGGTELSDRMLAAGADAARALVRA